MVNVLIMKSLFQVIAIGNSASDVEVFVAPSVIDLILQQESHGCWLMAQLFRLETENDLSPSKAYREMSTDL